MDRVGDARLMLAVRGRINLVVKVGLISLDQTSKPERVLSSSHFATCLRHDIWVATVVQQVVSTVVSLAIWQEIIRTTITMGSLVTLLEIVLNKERQSKSRTMLECTL